MGVTGSRLNRVSNRGATGNDSEPKANISTINVNTLSVARQEEGARIINMCFANAPVAIAA